MMSDTEYRLIFAKNVRRVGTIAIIGMGDVSVLLQQYPY